MKKEETDPEGYRCPKAGAALNCIPKTYESNQDYGIWQYRSFFAESMWVAIRQGLEDESVDPEEYECDDDEPDTDTDTDSDDEDDESGKSEKSEKLGKS